MCMGASVLDSSNMRQRILPTAAFALRSVYFWGAFFVPAILYLCACVLSAAAAHVGVK